MFSTALLVWAHRKPPRYNAINRFKGADSKFNRCSRRRSSYGLIASIQGTMSSTVSWVQILNLIDVLDAAPRMGSS